MSAELADVYRGDLHLRLAHALLLIGPRFSIFAGRRSTGPPNLVDSANSVMRVNRAGFSDKACAMKMRANRINACYLSRAIRQTIGFAASTREVNDQKVGLIV